MIVLVVFFLFPALAFSQAPEFHINPATDGTAEDEAQQFVGQAVSSVTSALGSPSMIRNAESGQVYIFIGNQNVYIFSVEGEGKAIVQVTRHSRGEWDGGLYAVYAE
jgi:hypothetical protein